MNFHLIFNLFSISLLLSLHLTSYSSSFISLLLFLHFTTEHLYFIFSDNQILYLSCQQLLLSYHHKSLYPFVPYCCNGNHLPLVSFFPTAPPSLTTYIPLGSVCTDCYLTICRGAKTIDIYRQTI